MPAPRHRLTREEQQEQTRNDLLAAATALFAERGVNGASIEQISERAGYSRGAFYSNFEDKQDLVLALQEARTRREYEEIRALIDANRVGEEPFRNQMEALRAWHRERAAHQQSWLALRTELWLFALRHDAPTLRERMATTERFAQHALRGGIAQAMERAGVEPPADLDFLALIMHALEDGLLIQRVIRPEDTTDDLIVDAVDVLIRAWIALAREGATPSDRPSTNA